MRPKHTLGTAIYIAVAISLLGCLRQPRRDAPLGGGVGGGPGSGPGARSSSGRAPLGQARTPGLSDRQNPISFDSMPGTHGFPGASDSFPSAGGSGSFSQDGGSFGPSSAPSPADSIAHGGGDANVGGRRPLAPASPPDATGLARSGVGDNASFGYAAANYREPQNPRISSASTCQGTMTKKQDGICSFVTAAHCLADAEDAADPTPPPIFQGDIRNPDKKQRKLVSISSPEFGSITALAMLNPTWTSQNKILAVNSAPGGGISIQKGATSHDIAMVFFKGEACEKSTPVISPLTQQCASGIFKVASRWKQRALSAVVNFAQKLSDRLKVDIDETGIKPGDSGGSLICIGPDNTRQTMGVLSTNDNEGSGFSLGAFYSAGQSTLWAINAEQQAFNANSEIAKLIPNSDSRGPAKPTPLPGGQLAAK